MNPEPFQLPETITVADLTPKLVPSPSRKEIGRARRQFYTRVLPTVVACGHKLERSHPMDDHQPSNNCESCWLAFWKTSVDLQKVHDELVALGPKKLTAKYGTKYVKFFQRYLSAELNSAAERIDGIPEEAGCAKGA